LPIARWTLAKYQVDPTTSRISVRPESKRKALRLVEELVASAGVAGGGVLTAPQHLPRAKA